MEERNIILSHKIRYKGEIMVVPLDEAGYLHLPDGRLHKLSDEQFAPLKKAYDEKIVAEQAQSLREQEKLAAKAEAERVAKAEQERLEREAKAERERLAAQQRAEQAARQRAEYEARQKAEQEAREQAVLLAQQKAEQEARERIAKREQERTEYEARQRAAYEEEARLQAQKAVLDLGVGLDDPVMSVPAPATAPAPAKAAMLEKERRVAEKDAVRKTIAANKAAERMALEQAMIAEEERTAREKEARRRKKLAEKEARRAGQEEISLLPLVVASLSSVLVTVLLFFVAFVMGVRLDIIEVNVPTPIDEWLNTPVVVYETDENATSGALDIDDSALNQ